MAAGRTKIIKDNADLFVDWFDYSACRRVFEREICLYTIR